jgi:hypothetical protein
MLMLLLAHNYQLGAQQAVVGQPGVVAAYGFEEGSGTTTADSTGNGSTGTLASTVWSANGRYGNGLTFNGTSSRVNVADSGMLDFTIGMTLEAWVNPTNLSNWRTVVIKETSGGLAYALYASDGSRPAVYINTGGGDIGLTGPTALPTNTWTHLATTFDGATLRLFVDGVQVASRAATGALLTSASPLRIGGNAVWGEYFAGDLDEVRLYGRALSAAEIQADMNAPVFNADLLPPTVTAVSPAPGAINVEPTVSVNVAFSEAMSAATINGATIELRGPDNQLVPAAVTYDPGSFTATLDPSADLASLTTYSVIVLGGSVEPVVKDNAGNPLEATAVSTFTIRLVDTTPPAITAVQPLDGTYNANPAAPILATFNEAIDPTTIDSATFELRDAANAVVPAVVTYDGPTRTAALQPSAPLGGGQIYSATLRGGAAVPVVKDLAGNALAASTTWVFRTALPPSATCPCTLFPETAAPTVASHTDSAAVELGLRFQTSRPGYISGLRFYKGSGNTGLHVGNLWTSTGVRLASVVFAAETASGWQQAEFVPAVPVDANTVYVVSYHAPLGRYAVDLAYFGLAVERSPLLAPAASNGGNGVYRYGTASAFPNQVSNGTNYWVDPVFVEVPPVDVTPPAVALTSPENGSTNVPLSTSISATFNEPLDPATVGADSAELRDGSSQLVPATVSYDATFRRLTITPTVQLLPLSAYTVTLKAGGLEDVAGNALSSDVVWSFTSGALPADEGPGGPILVVSSAMNPFGRYYAEILRSEGLNLFTVTDISLVTPATLAQVQVVLLGEMALTASQVAMLSDWVQAGGNLVAMRPDKQLAGLLGLTDAGGALANRYLAIDPAGVGAGLVSESLQYHGTADLYTATGATIVATLFSDATTQTPNPAVSLHSVGGSGGQAAAFAYDLARSVVYTRQGNPAWAGTERDGAVPIRSNDMFFGAAQGDAQLDWINLNKVAIPQADEQQRLLANLILQMISDRTPLPRIWYLPSGRKAAVVMTGDDHAAGGTAGRFDAQKALGPANCSVDDWTCVRSTSYIYPQSPLTAAQAAAYTADGFEVALHVTTDCRNYTPASVGVTYATQLAQFAGKYTSSPAPMTNRMHCIVWSDWASQPKVQRANGIRFDTSYYYWPGSWILDRPGLFTGSGMPMRFADLDGTTIDVYQAPTQLTDESNQTMALHISSLLDRALGPEGYYAVVTANMHTDTVASAGADTIITAARARNVAVVSAKQMLTWLDGRNSTSFGGLTWQGGVLSFTLAPGAGANNLQLMLPAASGLDNLVALTRNGAPVSFTVQTIKGRSYATFLAQGGAYTAIYGVPQTTLTATPANPTSSTSATFTFTAAPPATSFACSLDGAAFTTCTSPTSLTGLSYGSHTFQVRGTNAGGTDPTPASFTWEIVPPVPDTAITSAPSASTTSSVASFAFTANPAFGATFECALDGAAFAACSSPQAYTGLVAGAHTFQVRALNVTGADPTPASSAWTVVPPDTSITSAPAASTTSTSASFSFTANPPAGATFECALDGAAFTACSSPQAYTGLAVGGHTFQVRASSAVGTDPSPASFAWTVLVLAPPDTTITSTPAASTTSTSASFSFTATPSAGATFECALDGAAFAACTSPRAYTGLAVGGHTFQVRAVNGGGPDLSPASFSWTVLEPTLGLVAAYGFEETSGTTAVDDSGSGNTGTLANATRTASGRFGRALSFNGTNALVTVADSASLDLTNAMTFSAWVNPSNLSSWRTILLKEAPSGLAYGLYASNGSRPEAYIRIGGLDIGQAGTSALPTNTWTHVAATYDGATLRLYINGTQVATRAIGGSVAATTGALRIGGNLFWGEYFAGLIDEVRVYARVLTAAEITSDMNKAVKP